MDVPIVGQPARVLYWYPTAAVFCKCDPKKMNILVCTGIGTHYPCPGCGKLYTITSIDPSPEGPKIQIGIAMPISQGVIARDGGTQ